MAVSYVCGFETSSLYEAQLVNGSPTIVAGRNGQALRCNTTATTAYAQFMSRASGGTNRALFKSCRFYLKIGSLPAVTGVQICLPASAAAGGLSLKLNTNGTLGLLAAGTGRTASTNQLSADGLWHRIDFDCGWNTGNTGMRVFVDGVQWATDTTDTSVTANTQAQVGVCQTGTTDLYFDDIVFYDTALPVTLADYNLNLLKPTSDVAAGNWKRNDGTTGTSLFSAVDNSPPTGTAVTAVLAANYIQNGTAGSTVAADQVDLACAAYSSISGLASGSQVSALMSICNDAQQVTTGSPKSGALTMSPNGLQLATIPHDTGASLSTGATTTNAAMAESFVATGAVGALALLLAASTTPVPTDFVFEIQTDASGSPSGTPIGSTITVSGLTTSLAWISGDVNAALVNGTTYWVVLRRTGTPALGPVVLWATGDSSVGNVYAGGAAVQLNSGTGVWSSAGANDFSFRLNLAADTTFDFGLTQGAAGSGSAAAQGIYPAGWGTHAGAVSESPSVAASDTPTVRVKRTGTYTRVLSVDMAGVYVMWSAAVASNASPVRLVTQQARVRSNVY